MGEFYIFDSAVGCPCNRVKVVHNPAGNSKFLDAPEASDHSLEALQLVHTEVQLRVNSDGELILYSVRVVVRHCVLDSNAKILYSNSAVGLGAVQSMFVGGM